MPASGSEVTALLHAWQEGDRQALEKLMTVVYGELRQLAKERLSRERANHTLQPTALVNELYLRLMVQKEAKFTDRTHFLAVAAQMMRRLLVEHARKQKRAKRGGGVELVTLVEVAENESQADVDLLDLHEALDRLAAIDAKKSQLVELRYFGGLSYEEAAEVLGISLSTVKREWWKARAWLFSQLRPESSV